MKGFAPRRSVCEASPVALALATRRIGRAPVSIQRGDLFVTAGGRAHPQGLGQHAGQPRAASGSLSEQDAEIPGLSAEGYTNLAIPSGSFLSGKTVDTHGDRITDEQHLEHRSELVQYALVTGLLHEQPERASSP